MEVEAGSAELGLSVAVRGIRAILVLGDKPER